MTPAERKALLFLSSLALLGAGVRAVRAVGGAPPRSAFAESGAAGLRTQIAAVDSARAVAGRGRATRGGTRKAKPAPRAGTARAAGAPSARRAAAPALGAVAGRGQPVDLDRAGASELEGLPYVGPVLAARIVADRDSLGPFGSLEGLERVRGVGPSLARKLAPHVTFSLTPRPPTVVEQGGRSVARERRHRLSGSRSPS